jgi:hypothetical protein
MTISAIALALAAQAAIPQATVQAPAAPIAVQPTTGAVLRVGAEVPLRLSEELTTKGKKLRVGHRFNLQTSEPVMVNGVTVIPVGSPAVGEITMSATRACGASPAIWARESSM